MQVAKYHQQHDNLKAKAAAENEKVRQKMYQAKAGGQWKPSRDMNEINAKAVIGI